MATETYSDSIDDLAAREAIAASIPDVVKSALGKLADDPGAIFEGAVLEAIKDVRQVDPAGYARIRAQAKDSKVSLGQLDRLTVPDREDGASAMLPVVDPWPEAVGGAELLAELCQVLHQHVIADAPTITAAALWVIHTWCMDVFTVSPLAHITAPEKRCGKTVLLTALSRVVYRPLLASSISPAALFRSMELWQPTLLIDEADTFLRDNEEARGLINSGLYRETAFVIRTVGDDHIPTQFRTWGAKVVCGIGKLADTIEDRSIPLRMRRKVTGERVANIRLSDSSIWTRIQERIARWVEDNRYDIEHARPAPALGLNDRAQDCWEPLLAIADLAGGEWPGRARAAAQALHGIEEEAPSINAELLTDIREVFDHQQASRMTSVRLLELLTEDEDAPWATWQRGRPMTVRQLAHRLSEFGIKPRSMRVTGASGTPKGYALADFQDAFTRYLSLSAENPVLSATPQQPHNSAGSQPSASATASATPANYPQHATKQASEWTSISDVACGGSDEGVADRVSDRDASQTAPLSHCCGVADVAPLFGKKEEAGEKSGVEVLDL